MFFLTYSRERDISGLLFLLTFSSAQTESSPPHHPPPPSALHCSSENKWLRKRWRSLNRGCKRSLSSRSHPCVPHPQKFQCLFQRKHSLYKRTSSAGILLAASAKKGSLVCVTSVGKPFLGRGVTAYYFGYMKGSWMSSVSKQ